MIVNLLNCNKDKEVALALGYFDAIHIGHQSIFDEVLKTNDAIPSVFTFSNNIYKLLNKDIKEIYTFAERCRIIRSYGIENIYFIEATPEILELDGNEFLDMLNQKLNIKLIVSGDDYRYGKAAENGKEQLQQYCIDNAIDCVIKPLIMQNKEKISSTAIRKFIKEGDMESVKAALGRYYSVTNKVVTGRRSGHTIGYPTINLPLNGSVLSPKYGVYASHVIIDNKRYKGVTNIGSHPTFDDYYSNIETHIINYSGDLYGKSVTVEIIKYLREVKHFENIDTLKAQIASDVKCVMEADYD